VVTPITTKHIGVVEHPKQSWYFINLNKKEYYVVVVIAAEVAWSFFSISGLTEHNIIIYLFRAHTCYNFLRYSLKLRDKDKRTPNTWKKCLKQHC
jgi:hypothetical protein